MPNTKKASESKDKSKDSTKGQKDTKRDTKAKDKGKGGKDGKGVKGKKGSTKASSEASQPVTVTAEQAEPGVEQRPEDGAIELAEQAPPITIEVRPGTSPESDEYDTDIEDEAVGIGPNDADFGIMSYNAACELLRITPAQRIIDGLRTSKLKLKYRSLGPVGAKALAAALMHNNTVEEVDLEENGLEGEGGVWLADMLRENTFINRLNLSKNYLGSIGAYAIGEMLQINNTILHLNLSENCFEDRDADNLAAGIERNEQMTHLNLSHNNFCEEGAVHLGRALGSNNAIEFLDLSWNQIRRKGAVFICNGLKRNYCITCVKLGWNGFGYEGALALSEMVRGNKYLRELDISNNRINWEGALLIAKGLKENDTLEILQIGHNPLTMTGCLDIIEAVDNNISVLSFLGLQGIPVNRKIVYMAENIAKARSFKIEHGGLLDSEDILGRRMVLRCDPLKLLIQFLSDKGIRPVDLFRTFDKDNQHRVSREQFVQGLKKAKVPLDDYELERVLNRLDSAKEGKISYQRLMRGVKEQIKHNRAEEKRRLVEERKMLDSHARIMNPDLPTASQARLMEGSLQDYRGTASQTSLIDRHTSSGSSISTVLSQNVATSLRFMQHYTGSQTSLASKSGGDIGVNGKLRGSLVNLSAPLGQSELVLSTAKLGQGDIVESSTKMDKSKTQNASGSKSKISKKGKQTSSK